MAHDVRDNPDEHRYEVLVGDEVAGFSRYERDGDRLTFVHTEVDDEHAGQGLAKALVIAALDDAEARGLAVVPECGYVRKVLADDAPRHLALVPDDVRASLDLPA